MRPSRSFARRSLSSPCVRMAEKAPRRLRIAALKLLADDGRADADAVQRHLRHDLAADAAHNAGGLQKRCRALAVKAEAVVVPADDVRRTQPPDQIFLKKCLPRHFHHGAVEVLKDHLVHAVETLHQERALVHRAQKRRGGRAEQPGRMRVKAHGRRRDGESVRRSACAAQQRAVANVNAVKKTERNCAWSVQVMLPRKNS